MYVVPAPLVDNGATNPIDFTPSTDRATIVVWGDFGGGTAALQMSPNNGVTWIPVIPTVATSFTANGMANFQINISCKIRVELTGATLPNLNIAIGMGLSDF